MRSAKSRWCDQLWKVKESLRKESPHGATGMQLVPIASMRLRQYNSYLETKWRHVYRSTCYRGRKNFVIVLISHPSRSIYSCQCLSCKTSPRRQSQIPCRSCARMSGYLDDSMESSN